MTGARGRQGRSRVEVVALAVGGAPNGFCEGLPKRGETTILRAPLRSYNDRFHHLCKVTRTLLPRAQVRSR